MAGSVGNNKENRFEDVKQVQRGLSRLGFTPKSRQFEPSGIIDSETVDAVRKLQKLQGLKVDGYLHPGGETEGEINKLAYARADEPVEDLPPETETPSPSPEEGGDDPEKTPETDEQGEEKEEEEDKDKKKESKCDRLAKEAKRLKKKLSGGRKICLD